MAGAIGTGTVGTGTAGAIGTGTVRTGTAGAVGTDTVRTGVGDTETIGVDGTVTVTAGAGAGDTVTIGVDGAVTATVVLTTVLKAPVGTDTEMSCPPIWTFGESAPPVETDAVVDGSGAGVVLLFPPPSTMPVGSASERADEIARSSANRAMPAVTIGMLAAN